MVPSCNVHGGNTTVRVLRYLALPPYGTPVTSDPASSLLLGTDE